MAEEVVARRYAIALLTVIIFWQVYVVAATISRAATFFTIFNDLGAELPLPTRVFFATYRWWFIVPVVFVVFLIDLLRRTQIRVSRGVVLVASALVAAFLMQAFATEALFRPMFSLIEQVR